MHLRLREINTLTLLSASLDFYWPNRKYCCTQ